MSHCTPTCEGPLSTSTFPPLQHIGLHRYILHMLDCGSRHPVVTSIHMFMVLSVFCFHASFHGLSTRSQVNKKMYIIYGCKHTHCQHACFISYASTITLSHTHTYAHALAHSHTRTHARMLARTHACTHTHTHTHTHAHTHTRTHARTHARTHTHTHTRMRMLRWICGVTKLDTIGNESIRGTTKVRKSQRMARKGG